MKKNSPSREPRVRGTQTASAVSDMRRLLFSGEIASGSRIAELMLVKRLGVSRTPIRSALQHLALEGLLDPMDGGGYRLRSYLEKDLADDLEVRATLEGLAARWAAERGVEPDLIMKLRELLSCMDGMLRDGWLLDRRRLEYASRGQELHQLMADVASSDTLDRYLETTVFHPFVGSTAYLQAVLLMHHPRTDLSNHLAGYRRLVDAIASREGSRAEFLARELARSCLDVLLRHYRAHHARGRRIRCE